MMPLMFPPHDAVNLKYDHRPAKPGTAVEVFERDLESLKAEGWTSTEPKPKRRRKSKSKTKAKPVGRAAVKDEDNGS